MYICIVVIVYILAQQDLESVGKYLSIAGTAVLCLGVAVITDRRNRIPPFLQPAFIGTLLAVIGMAFALNAATVATSGSGFRSSVQ
ncbi:hypothetical protein TELCIR_09176 [Teladorsagia circumcincta]|uniref:Uncharacterized protein n=1 Tax=Teladorsagia circumcincta TaxID=45464 RepID=A0A2G9UFJ0_TELCI|nr:hypothetical protein TELCIR_09176 [Teladorsagia circumcincta]